MVPVSPLEPSSEYAAVVTWQKYDGETATYSFEFRTAAQLPGSGDGDLGSSSGPGAKRVCHRQRIRYRQRYRDRRGHWHTRWVWRKRRVRIVYHDHRGRRHVRYVRRYIYRKVCR
jgi:hypothetical protein